jgi:hypothetical protein
MAEEANAQTKSKTVPLVWHEPGTSVFVNHVLAQFDGNSVYLVFGQANPPMIWGDTDEEKQRQLDQIQSVAILPVVRLAMAPQSFRAVAETIQKHLAMIDKIGEIDKSKQ